MSTVLFSGTVRLSATTSFLNTTDSTPFSSTITVSTHAQRMFVVSANVSDLVVSFNDLSAPSVIWLASDQIVRVNFGWNTGASMISLASAGMQFKDLFIVAGSGVSGVSNLHFANSGASAANVQMVLAQ